jgi:hypothetical protein
MTAQIEWNTFLSFSLQFLLVLFSLTFQFHCFVIKRRAAGVYVDEIEAHITFPSG